MNSVENINWQEGWLEAGTKQGEEQAEGWWNEKHADGWWKDEQTAPSSSAGWWTANDQTLWEPEGSVGAMEVNSVEPTYIKHDRWGQEWLMLNYDSGAAVTALPVAVGGDLPLEKQGELRVASGAVIPNLCMIKMKSPDESGVARSIRGHITEVAKPLLSAAEVSRRWDSLLFEDGGLLLERNSPVALEVRTILENRRVWDRHGKSIRHKREGNLYNAYADWRCHAGAHTGQASRRELDQTWRNGRGRSRSC